MYGNDKDVGLMFQGPWFEFCDRVKGFCNGHVFFNSKDFSEGND